MDASVVVRATGPEAGRAARALEAVAHDARKTQHVSFRDPIADVWPIAGRVHGRFSNNDDDEEEDDDDNMPLAKRKRVLAALQGQLASGPP